jgi:excisionase family DNA binding protein
MSAEFTKQPISLVDSLHGKVRALTVSEVATLLNVSERQVYKLAAEHRIPCFKIGGSIRFDPHAIGAWLGQKMAPASVDFSREERRRA